MTFLSTHLIVWVKSYSNSYHIQHYVLKQKLNKSVIQHVIAIWYVIT